jgi:anti-sigma28 factor (negative regulator of flagellin synthesis)
MVQIHGIGGIPEPVPDRPNGPRDRRGNNSVNQETSRDGVDISAQGRQAADIARVRAIADQEPDIRPERVAEAREAIERGDYKKEEIIVEIAKRLENLLS